MAKSKETVEDIQVSEAAVNEGTEVKIEEVVENQVEEVPVPIVHNLSENIVETTTIQATGNDADQNAYIVEINNGSIKNKTVLRTALYFSST